MPLLRNIWPTMQKGHIEGFFFVYITYLDTSQLHSYHTPSPFSNLSGQSYFSYYFNYDKVLPFITVFPIQHTEFFFFQHRVLNFKEKKKWDLKTGFPSSSC